jgi:hypothetical protein
MSIRAAMSSDDADIVSMVMGKPMKRIAPNFHIGVGCRAGGGGVAGSEGGDAARGVATGARL